MFVSHDWWAQSGQDDVRVKITVDEKRLGRLVTRARQNKTGKSRVGPLTVEITQRAAASEGAQEGRDASE